VMMPSSLWVRPFREALHEQFLSVKAVPLRPVL